MNPNMYVFTSIRLKNAKIEVLLTVASFLESVICMLFNFVDVLINVRLYGGYELKTVYERDLTEFFLFFV